MYMRYIDSGFNILFNFIIINMLINLELNSDYFKKNNKSSKMVKNMVEYK